MTFVLGLTGGIASGKTTVANYFRENNIPVVDADVISREVVKPNTEGLARIIDVYGLEVISEEGELQREKLAEIIFADKNARKQLNSILHPIIRRRILHEKEKLIAKNLPLIVLDVPLLFEADYQSEVDATMVVYVDKETQLKRLLKRNKLSEEEAIDRIHSQKDLELKKKQADIVIDNTTTIENTKLQVKNWLSDNSYISM